MKNEKLHYSLKTVRDGFTLIELLIVITIIGILAVMAIGSFGSARQDAQLDIAADSISSIIKEQQGNAKDGLQGVGSDSTKEASCYGVVFQTSSTLSNASTDPFVQAITVPYVAVPTATNSESADYCDTSNIQNLQKTPVDATSNILLTGLKQAGIDMDSLVIMFKPPFGAVLEGTGSNISDSLSAIGPASTPSQDAVQIFLNLPSSNPQTEKGLQFDPFSGLVSSIDPSTAPSL